MTKRQRHRIINGCDLRFAAFCIGFLRSHKGSPLASVREARGMAALDTEGAQFWRDVADYIVAAHHDGR